MILKRWYWRQWKTFIKTESIDKFTLKEVKVMCLPELKPYASYAELYLMRNEIKQKRIPSYSYLFLYQFTILHITLLFAS